MKQQLFHFAGPTSGVASLPRMARVALAMLGVQFTLTTCGRAVDDFDVLREFRCQVAVLMFPDAEKPDRPLFKRIQQEIERLKADDPDSLETVQIPVELAERAAKALGIRPLMTAEEASDLVLKRWKSFRARAK